MQPRTAPAATAAGSDATSNNARRDLRDHHVRQQFMLKQPVEAASGE
jgi:hypothetical protein